VSTKKLLLANEDAQLAFAAEMARFCPPGLVIFLQGDLGTGKTTLVRGFLRALGHKGVVKSPTYTLVEPYIIDNQQIYHFDLYRLGDPDELEYAGGRDYFDAQSICLLEWPEKAAGFLPAADLVLQLAYEGEGRSLEISAETAAGKKLLDAISY